MKKLIIFPLLIVAMTSFIPMQAAKANAIIVNGETPSEAEALSTRALWIILLNSTNTDSLNLAVKLCTQGVEKDPEYADSYFYRGEALYFLSDFEGSLKDFDIAVEKRGDKYDYQYRGEAKFKLNDNEGALADYKKAQQKGFGSTESSAHLAMSDANNLGIAFYDAENYSKAVDAFTISVSAQETQNNVFNRGNAEYLSGDKAAALVDWKRSGKLGNKSGKSSYKKFRKEK